MKVVPKVCLLSLIILMIIPYSDSRAERSSKRSLSCAGKIAFQSIAFHAYEQERWHIYIMDGRGRYLRRITSPNKRAEDGDSQPALSRDGRKIVFTSWRDGNSEIYLMNSDGTHQRRLTRHSAFDESPTFSPNGRKVAFFSSRGRPEHEGREMDVYLMNVDGTGLVRLTSTPLQLEEHGGLSFSPDGRKLAFTRIFRPRSGKGSPIGPISICVMNSDGSGVKRLTQTYTNDTHPCFSPDGRKIVFSSGKGIGGENDIYIINADGTGRTQLTRTTHSNSLTDEDEPVFSPDGRKIAFISTLVDKDGTYKAGIYVMNSNGTGIKRITPIRVSASAMSWSASSLSWSR